ncbi:MAG: tetratricopeptide repeat protein [Bacteroidales bacterium]|nr:tetratricopeptide repeat protein [Bacteroidales bacterium]
MKRYTLFILMLLAVGGKAQESAEQWFDEANAAYNAGRYDSALMLYNRVAESELESVALYFNMGNAHYKLRDYPMAIYYYEKALKLDPSNDDARTNLAIANLAIVDKIEEVPQSFIAKGWDGLKHSLSGQQWTILSIVAFGLLLVSAFLFLRGQSMGLRKLGFFAGLLMLVVFALSVLFAAQLKQASSTEDQAIIMTPTVTVKSTPNEASVDLFVLHEGTKVEILDHADGWNKVRIANGSIGWLQAETMLAF